MVGVAEVFLTLAKVRVLIYLLQRSAKQFQQVLPGATKVIGHSDKNLSWKDAELKTLLMQDLWCKRSLFSFWNKISDIAVCLCVPTCLSTSHPCYEVGLTLWPISTAFGRLVAYPEILQFSGFKKIDTEREKDDFTTVLKKRTFFLSIKGFIWGWWVGGKVLQFVSWLYNAQYNQVPVPDWGCKMLL